MKKKILFYQIGFVLSVLLTLVAFYLVNIHVNSGHLLISHKILTEGLIVLAVSQLLVQMVFFLHLHELKPRWNIAIFISTLGIVFIIVVGSIWIMNNLNYNMTPSQVNSYLNDQSSF